MEIKNKTHAKEINEICKYMHLSEYSGCAVPQRSQMAPTMLSLVWYLPIGCRGALLSSLLHVTVYVYTQFAERTGTYCK
jgi:hypothetical protein